MDGETLRESDGLAVASVNALLSAPERRAAPGLFRALLAGRLLHALGERKAAKILAAVRMALEMEPLLRVESLELKDAATREDVKKIKTPAVLEAVVHVGATRLADSVRLG